MADKDSGVLTYIGEKIPVWDAKTKYLTFKFNP
jgi:hypothetical protein